MKTDFERAKDEILFIKKFCPNIKVDVVIKAITNTDGGDYVFTSSQLKELFDLVDDKSAPASGNSTGA